MMFDKEPFVHAGIVSGKEIAVNIGKNYGCIAVRFSGGSDPVRTGKSLLAEEASDEPFVPGMNIFGYSGNRGGCVMWNGTAYKRLYFYPLRSQGLGTAAGNGREAYDDSFEIQDVLIGISFHWERRQAHRYAGALSVIVENGVITAVNIVPAELYIAGVISSEMNASSSSSLLKAHAVISRSWLFVQMEKRRSGHARPAVSGQEVSGTGGPSYAGNPSRVIKWYGRDDHENFDVCSDDHCQRYFGIGSITEKVADAVLETRGEALFYGDAICDARFSKCCGGMSENYSTCWDDTDVPYLSGVPDAESARVPDLATERGAAGWILSSPRAFCNNPGGKVLGQVLNGFDTETMDFFRWKVEYGSEELGSIVKSKTGEDFGSIVDLVPLRRGVSGRISEMEIIGSKKKCVVGKELEIRRVLSNTHLYSSAFVVEKKKAGHGITFILHGAGWGHGVGLCQIGAAVMGEKGYSYDSILKHYFTGSCLKKCY